MDMAMDVGNVEKVNLMIKELTKHGRVGSFDAALYEAQRVYRDVPSQETASTASGALVMEQKQEYASQPAPPARIDESQLNNLLREKLGAVLGAYHEGIMSEFRAMQDTIAELRREIVQLKQSSSASATSQQSQPQQKLVQDEKPAAGTEKPYNERQGNYTSDDVSIEKMFYFGNK